MELAEHAQPPGESTPPAAGEEAKADKSKSTEASEQGPPPELAEGSPSCDAESSEIEAK
jgi:hypothetical protein